MWGSPRDLELIDRIQSTYPSLETFLSSHGMQNAEGYKRGNRKQIYNGFNTIPIVDSDSFSPFYIPESRLERNEDNTFERDALEAGDIRTIPIPEPSETMLLSCIFCIG